ncbi:MAG: Flp pilus assembly complex ATPase component TadA, partial [Clostridia bacterium]|nr:Flp pilus assembly complex ATPase component TadA [Clostridia bacterium]
MERFLEIINKGIEQGATDIHLMEGSKPLYRIKRALVTNYEVEPMTKYEMVSLLEAMVGDNDALMEKFEQTKRIDIPYDINEGIRLRINASLSSGTPTFSIRVIRTTDIDIDAYRLREILHEIRKHKTGLVLITGKVNSGKTTTLNAFVQDVNKMFTKKIVMLEEPVEYIHKSNKSFIVQKEVGTESDVPSYYEGVINLLREDSDIAIVGEIRDRE